MSNSFFIGPIDVAVWMDAPDDDKPTSDLRIEPAAYERALVARWPDVGIAQQVISHCVLYWELPTEAGQPTGLPGQLFNDHQLVSFAAGPKQSLVDFVLWHRSYVPSHYRLYLFHAEGWERLELTPTTSEQDILDFTGITA